MREEGPASRPGLGKWGAEQDPCLGAECAPATVRAAAYLEPPPCVQGRATDGSVPELQPVYCSAEPSAAPLDVALSPYDWLLLPGGRPPETPKEPVSPRDIPWAAQRLGEGAPITLAGEGAALGELGTSEELGPRSPSSVQAALSAGPQSLSMTVVPASFVSHPVAADTFELNLPTSWLTPHSLQSSFLKKKAQHSTSPQRLANTYNPSDLYTHTRLGDSGVFPTPCGLF